MVLRARFRVAEKFHFRGASRANCRIATYKRISAGIVARITLAVNSFTIRRVLFSHPCRNRRFLPSSFPEAGHRSLIIHLSASAFHFREAEYTTASAGKFMNNSLAREGTAGARFRLRRKIRATGFARRVLRSYVAAGQVGR